MYVRSFNFPLYLRTSSSLSKFKCTTRSLDSWGVSEPLRLLIEYFIVQIQLTARQRQISVFMGDTEHAAVIYGSRTSAGNHIESDVDIMIFAEDEFCTNQTIHSLKNLVLRIFDEEKIARDAEVPYDRKLLVPISFAANVPQTIKESFHNEIPSIVKSTEYLKSDEMLSRLILNVLTVS